MTPGPTRRSPLLKVLVLPGAALALMGLTANWFNLGSPGWRAAQRLSVIAGLLLALAGWFLGRRLTSAPGKDLRTSLTTRRRVLFALVTCTVSFVLTFGACEVILRLLGRGPWVPQDVNITVEPGGNFFSKHPTLGYAHLPGRFRVTHVGNRPEERYSWTCTHGPDTLRITSPPHSPGDDKKSIWIFGCSFTYGESVNDEEAYPWLLREKLSDYQVVNFAVGGYGTVHSLIQFRAALEQRKKPELVVLAYASFHDDRNTFLRHRRKALVPYNKLQELRQPYARLDADGTACLHEAAAVYTEFFGMRYSAVMHAVERAYNNLEDHFCRSHEVTKALLKEFSDLCVGNGVRLVVAGLRPDSATLDTLDYCKANGILNVDISLDETRAENFNPPYVGHPSAKGHWHFAEKLYAGLKESGVLPRFH